MTNVQSKRRWGSLALVPEPTREPTREDVPQVSFCSHCGSPPVPGAGSRVCGVCELGLILSAGADVAPAPGAAFIVIDDSLSVCGVSAAAERLLATNETDAVNRHLTELVVPADAEAAGPHNLAVAVTWAARGDESMRSVMVRPANTFGVRIRARIARCGPAKAALLVFE
jgi:hypothetical protein